MRVRAADTAARRERLLLVSGGLLSLRSARARTQMLGRDRCGRAYWWFPACGRFCLVEDLQSGVWQAYEMRPGSGEESDVLAPDAAALLGFLSPSGENERWLRVRLCM